MTITVLIPTYCRYPFLRDLLGDLAAQTRPPDEVLIVDQTPEGERDECLYREFGGKLPLKVLYLTVARGLCLARNLGILHATSDSILFLDDDLRFEEELLSQYERVAAGGFEVVHGGVRFRDHALWKARPAIDDPVYQIIASPNTDQVAGTIGIAAGNSLVNRGLLTQLGGFDRQFDTGFEDWDFGMRVFYSSARTIYHPGPSVRHLKAPTGGRRDYFMTGWGRLLGSWREFTPSSRASLFYFYGKHFTRRGARRLCLWRLLEVFELKYRLFRYPWGVPIAVFWWLASVLRARRMLRAGPLTIGRYEQPPYTTWTSPAWQESRTLEGMGATLLAPK
ncbi:MAG: glycosyltransferase family 2 protein [Bryobacterales bacterium]|nr:glycosyltransferase family 2 protein [Bryobacterales bacterium]